MAEIADEYPTRLKEAATETARASDNSQLDGYSQVEMGRGSVCPATSIRFQQIEATSH